MRTLLCALAGAAILAAAGCGLSSGLPTFNTVPPFELTAENGQQFGSQQLAGRVWVVNFMFTTCNGPCPRMSSQMRKLQTTFKEVSDITLVSITVDPENDTPSALKLYAERFQADPERWHFLTGEKQTLNALSKDTFQLSDIGVVPEHSTRFVLVDRKSRIRGYYDSSDQETMSQLVKDALALRKEVI
jgi:protein SCO1/2